MESLILAYLRLLGPATPLEVAKFLGTTQTQLRQRWPDGLAEVSVEGRRAWLPPDRLEALRAAQPPRFVRLLPPSDPFLQARDRALVVPDKARQSAVWRPLGNPGAMLIDGEVAGIWRSRATGAKLTVSVTAFDPLPNRIRSAVREEAARVATVRALRTVDVTFES